MELRGAGLQKKVQRAAFAQASPEACQQIQAILVAMEMNIGLNSAACGLGVLPACWIALAMQAYATMIFIQMLQTGCFG